MADNDNEESESAETPDPAPSKKPEQLPDDPSNHHGHMWSWMEKTYWVLAIEHYGAPHTRQVWAWAQEQLFPLVQPYL